MFEKVFLPPRYAFLERKFGRKAFTLLDVGCGSRSHSVVRYHFPNATYHGVDSCEAASDTQYENRDKFFLLELETDSLAAIEDEKYDAIVFSHTIEHLLNGNEVVERLTRKLKVGGFFYIELPSLRSFFLPSADGTLNFFDDPTHVRMYDLKELANTLLRLNIRVLKLGKARSWTKLFFLTPIGIAYNWFYFIFTGRISAKGLLDVFGFADFILGQKHEIARGLRLGNWEETLLRKN